MMSQAWLVNKAYVKSPSGEQYKYHSSQPNAGKPTGLVKMKPAYGRGGQQKTSVVKYKMLCRMCGGEKGYHLHVGYAGVKSYEEKEIRRVSTASKNAAAYKAKTGKRSQFTPSKREVDNAARFKRGKR